MENTSYNHLAGRVNELSAENAKLKENVNAYRDAYLKAKRRAEKAEAQLAAAKAVGFHRLPCDNGGIQNAKR